MLEERTSALQTGICNVSWLLNARAIIIQTNYGDYRKFLRLGSTMGIFRAWNVIFLTSI